MRRTTTLYVWLCAVLLSLPTWATMQHARTGLRGPAASAAAAKTSESTVQAAPLVFNFYPNPSRGQLTVQVGGQRGQDYKLRLTNILGREVRLQALRPDQAAEGLAVDLTGLPTGLYFYSLLQNDKVLTTKRLTLQGD